MKEKIILKNNEKTYIVSLINYSIHKQISGKGYLNEVKKMMLNRIVLTAIILIILLTILQLVLKFSFTLFSIAILILIIVAIVGYFKK